MDEKVLMTLILDKDMVITDAPCTAATVIAQYGDGHYILAIAADGTWVFGREEEQPLSVDVHDLLHLLQARRGGEVH